MLSAPLVAPSKELGRQSNILVYAVKFSTKSCAHSTAIICFNFPHQIHPLASNACHGIVSLISNEDVCVYVCTCRLLPQIKQLDVVNAEDIYSIQLFRHSIFDSSAKRHTFTLAHTHNHILTCGYLPI